MRAVICKEFGPLEGLLIGEAPLPPLRQGCVRIGMKVAALNPPDVLMVQGKYQVRPQLPFIPGVEGAGTILEIASDVTGFSHGDRVMTYAGQGCFSEQVVVPAARVHGIPQGMTDEVASGFVLAYGTAHHALVDCGRLARNETLVVLGAAGGLGLCAIDIGKAIGARVIAVASSGAKCATCLAHGADEVIDISAVESLRDAIKGKVPSGADVVFDVVGGAATEASLRAIAPYGRLLIVGYASGEIPSIKGNLILLKQASVVGVSFRLLTEQNPQAATEGIRRLSRMWSNGQLHPEVTAEFPLSRVVDALRLLAERKAIGKIALRI